MALLSHPTPQPASTPKGARGGSSALLPLHTLQTLLLQILPLQTLPLLLHTLLLQTLHTLPLHTLPLPLQHFHAPLHLGKWVLKRN